MMKGYNPLEAPEPKEWLDLDELERIDLVEDYHRHARVLLPNLKAHAILHSIVENQAALGDETPVRRTLDRLTSEGIDRHEAVHAVSSVLIEHMSHLAGGELSQPNLNAAYFVALEALTVESWRKSYE